MFLFVGVLAVPTVLSLLRIRPDDIDFDRARGCDDGPRGDTGPALGALLRDRVLVAFLVAAVLFHCANAAMLPLLGELLAKGQGRSSMLFMSACVITTQVVITFTASSWGHRAASWGRRPLLLVAFIALPIRGLLCTLTDEAPWLVGIQVLDGLAAGIFGVVSVLVIADRTRGTGRFNLALGASTTAIGIGASLSQVIAGSLAHHFGKNAGFLMLAAVGVVALAVLYVGVRETGGGRAEAQALQRAG